MSHGQGLAVQTAATERHRLDALRAGIEAELRGLRTGAQIQVRNARLAETPAAIADVADEVLHEAVTRALAKGEHYDPTRPVRPWILRFVSFVIRERIGERQRDREHMPPRYDEEDDGGDDGLALVVDLAAQQHERIMELLDLVSPTERQVLNLRFVEGLDGPALAAALGIKEGAARVRLSRAVAHLRRAYDEAERAGTGER